MTSILLICLTLFAATQPATSAGDPPLLILVTQSRGFVHDVVKRDAGPSRVERTISELAERSGLFRVEWTDDVRTLTPQTLRRARLIVFYTTGDLPFTDEQFDAFEDWLSRGGGFLGIHCAADTLGDHPRYPKLLGGTFDGHPWNADATVTIKVHDPDFIACRPFVEHRTFQEEIYQFKNFDPERVRVLMSLDMQATELKKPYHVPIAWCREHGDGRVFYTSLGHRDDMWASEPFQQHLLGAIEWLLEPRPADATPNPEVSRREDQLARDAAGD